VIKTIFITGVSASGKSTIGKLLAKKIHYTFFDADDYHPPENIEKMKNGVALTDDDRWDWLKVLNSLAKESNRAIITCSALKESYRRILDEGLEENEFHFFHLQGSKELISQRIKNRLDHFMPSELIDSQFDSYEMPTSGTILKIAQEPKYIVQQIINVLDNKTEIGVIGLGVMGTSIARNIARSGFSLSIFNRHIDEKEVDVAIKKKSQYPELKNILAFDNLKNFVKSLARPRKILLMVNAGAAVDAVINELLPYLDEDDIVIDGGNSYYKDTQKRFDQLKTKAIHFIGSGVSGGEQGALLGPSMMPGGEMIAYDQLKPIFEKIAAKSPTGKACCSLIGSGGAGHFVKMVHNGIEYGEMQLIAECYACLRFQNDFNANEIANIFSAWSSNGMDSYLLDITIDILKEKDQNGVLVLDKILDKAGNKGTGAWTTIAAAELGVAIPTITAALFGRFLSFFKEDRKKLSKVYKPNSSSNKIDPDNLKLLYQICRIVNHHQGIKLILAATDKYQWDINLSNLINVWTAGCIIRSSLLLDILKEIENEEFLAGPFFTDYIGTHFDAAKASYINIASGGIPYPAIAASMEYFKTLIQAEGNANMIQAQRDFFGAHTFKLKSDPTGPAQHHKWLKN